MRFSVYLSRLCRATLAILTLELCGSLGCGVREEILSGTIEQKEAGDTVRVQAATPRLLKIGYQKGSFELKLVVARAPENLKRYDTMCLRVAGADDWPFLQSGVVESCGAEFFQGPQNTDNDWVATADAPALMRRNERVTELFRQMQRMAAPTEAARLWTHALAHLEAFTSPLEAGSLPRSSALAARIEPLDIVSPDPDNHGPPAMLALDNTLKSISEMQANSSFFLGPLDPYINKLSSPREFVVRPDLEFRQELELFSKNTRRYLLLGEMTDMDHSAAHILVYARKASSQQAWYKFAETWTQNHGTPPTDPEMHVYATCRDLPITSGFFAWKGEYPGVWGGDHICNDDTRYQLWHAYGMWSEEVFCNRPFQSTRPTCDKPW